MGFPFQSSLKCYTTTAVYAEVEHIKRSYNGLQALIDAGKLRILEPEKAFTDKVINCANETGDKPRLTLADISVIALALQLNRILISDDYAVGNVASQLQVAVKPIAFNGIKELRKWISYCPACRSTYRPNISICRICGGMVRRRYVVRKP